MPSDLNPSAVSLGRPWSRSGRRAHLIGKWSLFYWRSLVIRHHDSDNVLAQVRFADLAKDQLKACGFRECKLTLK